MYRDGLLEAFQGFTGDMSVSELLNASASCCPNMHGCYDAFTITGISIHMQSTGLKKHYETTLEGVIRNKLERAFTRAARGGFAQRFARQRRRWISSGRWCRLRRSAQSVVSALPRSVGSSTADGAPGARTRWRPLTDLAARAEGVWHFALFLGLLAHLTTFVCIELAWGTRPQVRSLSRLGRLLILADPLLVPVICILPFRVSGPLIC